jgi:hypothetical protein
MVDQAGPCAYQRVVRLDHLQVGLLQLLGSIGDFRFHHFVALFVEDHDHVLPVVQAKDGTSLERNRVYVAPPGGHVAVMNAALHLMEGPKGEMPPLPIDSFFRSLAQNQKDRAICIVLSGTGSDGTVGLKAVKGEAGMAMVQEVQSARYAGMPASIIATTLADYVLPPAAMPAQHVAYAATMSSYRRALADEALPELIESRPDGYTLRAWVPGCASGAEACTLAILLRECLRKGDRSFEFQVFGADLDAKAIETALASRYPAGIAADVPRDLLQRYFIEDDGTYRVRQEVREMIVFAPHNVIKDPPFTKIDLLSCRNLMIYLNADLQKRLLPIFHYALKPEWLLMLGSSETIGRFGERFATVDKKWPAPLSPLKEAPPRKGRKTGARAPAGREEELERELRHTKESLQTTVEELETSNEELQSTNEELQSTNEELQSSNEELETSKEEMQSLNEERGPGERCG